MTAGHAQGLAVAVVGCLLAVFVAGLVLLLMAGDLVGGDLVMAGIVPMGLAGAVAGAAGARVALARGVRGRDAFLVAVGGAFATVVAVTALLGASGAGEALVTPLVIVLGAGLGARTVVRRLG